MSMKVLKTDVAIIGAGGAGACAAIAAQEQGVKVAILEKAPVVAACATSFAGCVFGVESEMQKERGIALTRQKAFELFMEHNHWAANSRLIRKFVDGSADTIEWLKRNGMEFPVLQTKTGSPDEIATAHVLKPCGAGHGGVGLVQKFVKKAREQGAEVLLGCSATELIKDENGRVIGVLAEQNGEQIRVDAKAVVISTGGYGANAEMVKEHDGYELGEDLLLLHEFPQITGDGLKMAWAAGAAETGRGPQLAGYVIKGPGIAAAAPWIVLNQLKICIEQPWLWVSQDGKRFMDESKAMDAPNVSNAIEQLRDKCAYIIFDGACRDFLATEGAINHMDLWGDAQIKDLDAQINRCIKAGNKDVFIADSLEELCDMTGIDKKGLLETVENYNAYSVEGCDREFGKDPRFLAPVKTPKYYAFRVVNNFYGTIGGIKTDEFMQVVNTNGKTIPGLYAAGADACNHYGAQRPTYNIKLSGGTLGWALNSGRMAGTNAAIAAKN